MKRKQIVILAAFLCMTSVAVHAQGFHIGAKVGTNIVKIDGRSFDEQFRYGFSLGGFAELDFSKKFGLQPELLWNQSKTTTASNFNDIYVNGINNRDITLNYLSIPILLSYNPIPILSIQAGPQFGILLNESQTLLSNGGDAFKKGDFSLVGGAQLNLGAFRAGARYFVGLNNLDDVTKVDNWKNQGLQFYIGLKIF